MGSTEHAKREFKALGYTPLDENPEDDPNKWIQENVLELLEVFSKQGHSGSSAPFCVSYFKKLAMFEPLCPLQGTDDEWTDSFSDDGTMQNKRCSHVFKKSDGQAYDINGKVFREPNGACYTSSLSRVNITFPYTPKTEYVDVAESGEDLGRGFQDCAGNCGALLQIAKDAEEGIDNLCENCIKEASSIS